VFICGFVLRLGVPAGTALALFVFSATVTLAQPATRPPVHITMQDLHAAGGVPPGWELTMQPGDVQGGRLLFFRQGCHKCHVVQGANLPAVATGEVGIGPELTGMGKHHPPAYFLESIVNPNAVVVDGPGHADATGRSTMPAYPDLTTAQLQDLVAFLSSLTVGEAVAHPTVPVPAGATPTPALPPNPLPAAPPSAAAAFLVQTYDVKPDQLAAFEAWFRDQFAPSMRAFDGVASVETVVDRTRRPSITTVFGFRDRAALEKWNNNLAMRDLAAKFDEFIGVHGHLTYDAAPVYRVPALSLPPP
jgi:mono/diheme cytochrome c family protein/quinol monooxygenase YgiN